ncbi:hypothetical protein EV401DRAFT_1886526 [Pisolithus croceorrhizus]|nr:hypothetical protein EV401DRAFT_1886526 [Pisolithus croceorrhizus]
MTHVPGYRRRLQQGIAVLPRQVARLETGGVLSRSNLWSQRRICFKTNVQETLDTRPQGKTGLSEAWFRPAIATPEALDPPREGDRERSNGPLHRRCFASPAGWEKELYRELGHWRDRDEDKPCPLTCAVLSWFIGQLPILATFNNEPGKNYEEPMWLNYYASFRSSKLRDDPYPPAKRARRSSSASKSVDCPELVVNGMSYWREGAIHLRSCCVPPLLSLHFPLFKQGCRRRQRHFPSMVISVVQ